MSHFNIFNLNIEISDFRMKGSFQVLNSDSYKHFKILISKTWPPWKLHEMTWLCFRFWPSTLPIPGSPTAVWLRWSRPFRCSLPSCGCSGGARGGMMLHAWSIFPISRESSVDTNDTKVTIEFCRCDETFWCPPATTWVFLLGLLAETYSKLR